MAKVKREKPIYCGNAIVKEVPFGRGWKTQLFILNREIDIISDYARKNGGCVKIDVVEKRKKQKNGATESLIINTYKRPEVEVPEGPRKENKPITLDF